MPDVVQFIHPGGEHGQDVAGHKRWNTSDHDHRRKFLCVPGEYVAAPDAPPLKDELVFWGEWEPESEVEPVPSPVAGGPRWLHRPYYVTPNSYAPAPQVVLQNTDPFVFGDSFQYTLCRQLRRHRKEGPFFPTALRDLAPGSLILFGSPKKTEGFLLDTVFVVADEGVLHDLRSWPQKLHGRISDVYEDVTMRATYAWEADQPALRHYIGATPQSRVGGMFSFVPALPASAGGNGFARPSIRLDGVIKPSLPMGAKRTRDLAAERVRELWEEVVAQVGSTNCVLGTHFDLPPKRDS